MKLNVRKEGEVNVVECSGTMRTGVDVGLRSQVSALVEDGARRFVFNMAGVPWMDSGAVGEVTAAGKHIMDSGGQVGLILSKKTKDVFMTFHLHDVFDIYPDEKAALEKISD
ncbi:MAG: STAS domain-containing protein [Acidobacteriota bacterium]|nr:STAS domain-containing protein [Acidobacteriota bacterium]